jgi:hypothetical protein
LLRVEIDLLVFDLLKRLWGSGVLLTHQVHLYFLKGFLEFQVWLIYIAEFDDVLHVEDVLGGFISRLLMGLCMLLASASALLNVLSGLFDYVLILSIDHGLMDSFQFGFAFGLTALGQ